MRNAVAGLALVALIACGGGGPTGPSPVNAPAPVAVAPTPEPTPAPTPVPEPTPEAPTPAATPKPPAPTPAATPTPTPTPTPAPKTACTTPTVTSTYGTTSVHIKVVATHKGTVTLVRTTKAIPAGESGTGFTWACGMTTKAFVAIWDDFGDSCKVNIVVGGPCK